MNDKKSHYLNYHANRKLAIEKGAKKLHLKYIKEGFSDSPAAYSDFLYIVINKTNRDMESYYAGWNACKKSLSTDK